MNKVLRIAHLYPELLNLYADKGNIQTLKRRLQWRGIGVDIDLVGIEATLRLQDYHLVLLGGGSDREQELVSRHLYAQRTEWRNAVDAGLVLLAICGGYQLLGDYYQISDGSKIPGLAVLDLETTSGSPRLIGNVAIDTLDLGTIVGFENHAGRTTHRHAPLGQVLKGHGNNGSDGQEGVRHLHIFGTYIHGPLLPKNPQFADYVLQTAMDYAELPYQLSPIDDTMENAAHEAFLHRRLELSARA